MRLTQSALMLVLGLGLAAPVLGEKPTTRPAATQPAGAYVCPMCHTSADKASKCPDCGMDMKKAEDVKKDKKMSHDDKPW